MNKTASNAWPLAAALLASLSAPPSRAAVLWSNLDDTAFVGVISQNFEASFDVYDSQGADDFVVPDGEVWIVKKVEVLGDYGSGGTGQARSENVVFYRNDGGLPGSVIEDFPEVVGKEIEWGRYLITLPKPLKLKPGKHWVSVQINMDWALYGPWNWWTTRTLRKGSRAAWKNPGDGFDTGCVNYGVMQECIGAFGEGPDFQFVLHGQRIPRP